MGDERAECEGKERFENWTRAMDRIRQMSRRGGPGRLRPYPCSHCGGYHVGNAIAEKAYARTDEGRQRRGHRQRGRRSIRRPKW